MSQYKVFLCHNSKDKPQVREIRDQLEQQGIETWMDEQDIKGFDDWKKKIKENLSQMNAVAVLLGSSGFGEWQKYEIIYTEQEINRREQNKLLPLRAGLVILKSCQQTFQKIRDRHYDTPYGWLFINPHMVDLRASKAPMKQLIEAITEQRWHVDYTRLENLLKAGQWKEADQETLAVMLKTAGREKEGWLDIESIQNFPRKDLHTIDQLWVEYSDGHFGFSVQKRISESVGKDYEKFGDRVGWGKGMWLNKKWLDYNEIIFSLDAPEGHLPVGVVYGSGSWFWGLDATLGVHVVPFLQRLIVFLFNLLSRPDL
ncbi:GUN4 domain-containing protein [Scytonema sp. HK-05]|uniref:GUN4 domain-containing protein n=1 Tax=Scytonema sp. HK-05 TaxID=1137095 RepID=UPI000937637F|nr:GUN4 domain-containing protein [Scytonema sp. HK-05]BAY48112.1 GUN4 domain-containing protein [Scytonema sp. HK-05]